MKILWTVRLMTATVGKAGEDFEKMQQVRLIIAALRLEAKLSNAIIYSAEWFGCQTFYSEGSALTAHMLSRANSKAGQPDISPGSVYSFHHLSMCLEPGKDTDLGPRVASASLFSALLVLSVQVDLSQRIWVWIALFIQVDNFCLFACVNLRQIGA
jgi:hypothetical protein